MKKHMISYLVSILTAVAVYAGFLAAVTGIILSKDIEEKYLLLSGLIGAAVAAFSGGAVCGRRIGKRGILHGAVSQLFVFLIIAAVSFCVSHAITWKTGILFCVCTCFGAAGGIASVNLKRK